MLGSGIPNAPCGSAGSTLFLMENSLKSPTQSSVASAVEQAGAGLQARRCMAQEGSWSSMVSSDPAFPHQLGVRHLAEPRDVFRVIKTPKPPT